MIKGLESRGRELKQQLKSILNDPPGKETVEPAETTIVYVVNRHCSLCVVPEVERFQTDLCPHALGQSGGLEQRQVSIPNSWPIEAVAR